MKCYLFDIDGTIADLSHRLRYIERKPKDWRRFFSSVSKDAPITHIIDLAKHLSAAGLAIVYVSGRSAECRADTLAWMKEHGLPKGELYMRAHGDRRPDYVVKGELLDKALGDGYEPIMAFDDRDQVVEMWRKRGVPCAQVAEGAF